MNKIAGQLIFPKYFYTAKVNRRCKLKEKFKFYFSPIEGGYDLNNLFLYDWLLKLKDISWRSYHNETSNSLTVDHGVFTKRLMRLQKIMIESAISDNLVEQAPKVIEIMVG